MSDARSTPDAVCENVMVTTGDGRVFDLGKPGTRNFKRRLKAYTAARSKESEFIGNRR